jgi:hypothetical protein
MDLGNYAAGKRAKELADKTKARLDVAAMNAEYDRLAIEAALVFDRMHLYARSLAGQIKPDVLAVGGAMADGRNAGLSLQMARGDRTIKYDISAGLGAITSRKSPPDAPEHNVTSITQVSEDLIDAMVKSMLDYVYD